MCSGIEQSQLILLFPPRSYTDICIFEVFSLTDTKEFGFALLVTGKVTLKFSW